MLALTLTRQPNTAPHPLGRLSRSHGVTVRFKQQVQVRSWGRAAHRRAGTQHLLSLLLLSVTCVPKSGMQSPGGSRGWSSEAHEVMGTHPGNAHPASLTSSGRKTQQQLECPNTPPAFAGLPPLPTKQKQGSGPQTRQTVVSS